MVRTFRIGIVVAALALLAVAVDLAEPRPAGPTSAPSDAAPSSAPSEAPVAVHAESTDGDFVLTFDVPRATWHATDSVTGTAELMFGGIGPRTLYGSGFGVIGFTFQEIGGSKHGEQVWHADCGHHAIATDAPLTRALRLGVGWTPEDPDASSYAAFAADPGRHLPVADWQLTALALFDEFPCTGEPAPSGAPGPHDMRADLLIHVAP